MTLTSLKPFIPSGKDFQASKRFFQDLGFEVKWESGGYAELTLGAAAFLLQDYHNQEMQDNLMMAADVEDLDAWWTRIQKVLPKHPGARAKPPTDYPWGRREVHLVDPAGVCWHFAQSA